jgi:hypothetical protein
VAIKETSHAKPKLGATPSIAEMARKNYSDQFTICLKPGKK